MGEDRADQLRAAAQLALAGLGGLLVLAGLGYGLARLLRLLMGQLPPLGAVLCAGGVGILLLAALIVGLRAAVGRLVAGQAARRSYLILGLAMIMAGVPLLMVLTVVFLSLAGA